jgi:hypothetical protein
VTATPLPQGFYIYPALCNLNGTDRGIHFFNMPANSSLKIYNVSGELSCVVKNVNARDYFLDIRAVRMRSGVYIYFVTRGNEAGHKGRFAVIR